MLISLRFLWKTLFLIDFWDKVYGQLLVLIAKLFICAGKAPTTKPKQINKKLNQTLNNLQVSTHSKLGIIFQCGCLTLPFCLTTSELESVFWGGRNNFWKEQVPLLVLRGGGQALQWLQVSEICEVKIMGLSWWYFPHSCDAYYAFNSRTIKEDYEQNIKPSRNVLGWLFMACL